MKRLIVICLILACGCSVKAPDLQDQVNQHSAILAAITNYIADLQDKGMLPKPESKE